MATEEGRLLLILTLTLILIFILLLIVNYRVRVLSRVPDSCQPLAVCAVDGEFSSACRTE